MKGRREDTPGVIVPPPLILLALFLVGLGLEWLWPLAELPPWLRFGLGPLLVLAAGGLAVAALTQFRRARTAVEPWRPATALLTGGLYSRTRNPIYLSFLLAFAGAGLAAGALWTLLLLPVGAMILDVAVVRREERYLERRFGDDYRRYRQRTPRWL